MIYDNELQGLSLRNQSWIKDLKEVPFSIDSIGKVESHVPDSQDRPRRLNPARKTTRAEACQNHKALCGVRPSFLDCPRSNEFLDC